MPLVEPVRFGGVNGHGLVKRVCKRNCKRTTQHSTAPGITNQDHRIRNAEQEHTLSHYAAQASMRILELKNHCGCKRTVGSNPTLSASAQDNVLRIVRRSPNSLVNPRWAGIGKRAANISEVRSEP